MKITAAGGMEDLANFYSRALTERGYAMDEETSKDGSRTIQASDPKDPTSKLSVRIDPDAKDTSKFLLTFVKHGSPD